MLVDCATGALVPLARQVLDACAGDHCGELGDELVLSVVESGTPVCARAHEVEASLSSHRRSLADAAARVGCGVMSSGTHPFSMAPQEISGGERYAKIERDYPWVVQEAATYGLHVHVGVRGAEQAIAVCNELRRWLPHLLALSANSPFLRGEATGLRSTRVQLAQLYPRAGVPPIFADFADYERTIYALQLSPSVPDFSHTWWLVRPHPGHGTVEVRVLDAQTDVRRSAALAALIQALVAWIGDQMLLTGSIEPELQVVCEENLWAAARSGCEGELIDVAASSVTPIRDAVHELLHLLEPHFVQLESADYLPLLHEMALIDGATEQLEQFDAHGDMQQLTAHLTARTHGALSTR